MPRKQRRLTLITTSVRPELPPPPAVTTEPMAYGWRPEAARNQIPVDVHENWLRYQAQSILGRPVSGDEARELFSRIDVHTRQPIQPAPPRRWWHRLLEL